MIGRCGHLFEIPEEVTYLNCAYMSPQLRSVTEAGYAGVNRKRAPWKTVSDHFFDECEEVRGLFADLIDASADDIALVNSVSFGMGVASANLPLEKGQSIVLLDEQFPSNFYVWRELATARGGRLNLVRKSSTTGWTEPVIDAIDERTAIVATPNCHWTDGGLVDLEAVGKRCREVGAALAVDGTQSVGALDFSIERVKPDFLAVAGYKWMLGPYTTGFLYVAPEHQNGIPIDHGWMNRRDARNFAGLVKYKDEFAEGARRFDMGEHSNFALMPMVKSALTQLTEWTISAIGAELSRLTTLIGERGEELGLETAPTDQRGPHMLGLRFPGGVPSGLLEKLAENRVHVSVRGDSVRVSPHLYNDENDVNKLFGVLEPLLRRKV